MQGSDSFRLVVRRGPQPNQVYELSKDIVTLGRDITNDIVINDPEVSRHHLRLTRGAGGFTIEDLGSTNGTFVNGQRLTGARPLRPGDMVGLGETVTLAYEAAAAIAPGAEAPGMTAPGSAQRSAAMPPSPPPYVPAAPPPSPYAPVSPPPSPYAPASPPPYAGYDAAPQPAYGAAAPQPVAPGQPPAAGYDYDPYAAREEEAPNTTRLVLIGCGVLSLVCCCGTIGATVLVDQLCLWDRIPIVWDILSAFGLSMSSACF